MKKLFCLLFIIFSLKTFGQSEKSASQDFEKKIYIELNGRTSFYEVDDRYQLLNDTIYHTNSGFKIYPEYDTKKIGDKEYIIVRYPAFIKGKQVGRRELDGNKATKETTSPVHKELTDLNGKYLAIDKSDFELLEKNDYYSINFKKISNYSASFGVLTVPFKLRPAKDTISSSMTTDVTVGPYIGLTKRIAPRKRYYITIPVNLGLTYININDNNTSKSVSKDINVVPGVSWSTGLIFQLEDFNIGFVLGQDFASGIGNKWIYNKEIWYSFAIGYNFLKQ